MSQSVAFPLGTDDIDGSHEGDDDSRCLSVVASCDEPVAHCKFPIADRVPDNSIDNILYGHSVPGFGPYNSWEHHAEDKTTQKYQRYRFFFTVSPPLSVLWSKHSIREVFMSSV